MKINFKSLIDPKSSESSKRYIAILLTYFLMLITLLLFIPYEISERNMELLKVVIGAFTLIVTSAFVMNGIENVKQISEDKDCPK